MVWVAILDSIFMIVMLVTNVAVYLKIRQLTKHFGIVLIPGINLVPAAIMDWAVTMIIEVLLQNHFSILI